MISMCGQKASPTTPSEWSERGVQTTQLFFYWCLGERLSERAQRVSEGVNRHHVNTYITFNVALIHWFMNRELRSKYIRPRIWFWCRGQIAVSEHDRIDQIIKANPDDAQSMIEEWVLWSQWPAIKTINYLHPNDLQKHDPYGWRWKPCYEGCCRRFCHWHPSSNDNVKARTDKTFSVIQKFSRESFIQ